MFLARRQPATVMLRSASTWSNAQVVEFDRQHVFHPYTSMEVPLEAYLVDSAQGVHLNLADGRQVVDGMSSWWAAVHGYGHPKLDAAIRGQVDKMSHVMFGGITHRPAVELTEKLVRLSPEPLEKVFLCDSGSVSVEVAIKMAIQYWYKNEQPSKTKLLTIRSGYHGDTFGAMSVCDPVNGMHEMFAGILMKNFFAKAPTCGFQDDQPCATAVESMEEQLRNHHQEIAGVILEPIVQGAGGMRFYSKAYLRSVRELCDKYDVLLIADEIATGFGRTGEMFGCNHAGISPDIMCVGKALTGGYMTMGATLATEKVALGVSRNGGVFMHGPTFMGNPLACAVANASLELLMQGEWKQNVSWVEKQLNAEMAPLRKSAAVKDVRVLGAIGVCELTNPVPDMAAAQRIFVDHGVWLRPFGKLLYTMPTFNAPDLSPEHVTSIVRAMEAYVAAAESR